MSELRHNALQWMAPMQLWSVWSFHC